ncbi:glycosyltransferase 61 family protein [Psychrobacter sp. BI730]|uniref:glycosyltransferase 61 family protein n=1 Tax=Psychrobacter sp. BI730 TaxID=2705463 RepID=UPI0015CB72A7|nr:glycosyltransferase 61 family protein [Psychrobacter sp. BI730]NYR10794.1 DUF563 domain-containing protein [Psychrobacter sp. BI730]
MQVAEAKVLPQNNLTNPKNIKSFGVVNLDGLVNESLHFRGEKPIQDIESILKLADSIHDYSKILGNWYYGGFFHPHFGHFFSESIHRLRNYLENPENYDGIVFIPFPFKGSFEWLKNKPQYIEFILGSYLQINLEKIKWLTEPSIFSNLNIFEQESRLGSKTGDNYLNYLCGFSKAYKEPEAEQKNVILSRQNYLSMGRHLGIDYAFSKLDGFVTINPEEISIEEQIKLIVNADTIIIEGGSAVHLLDLIGYTEARVLFISRGANGNYWKNMYSNKCSDFRCFDKIARVESQLLGKPAVLPSVLSIKFFEDYLNLNLNNQSIELDVDEYYSLSILDIEKIMKMKHINDDLSVLSDFEKAFKFANHYLP